MEAVGHRGEAAGERGEVVHPLSGSRTLPTLYRRQVAQHEVVVVRLGVKEPRVRALGSCCRG